MEIFPLRIRVPRVPVAVQFTREGLVFVLLSLAIGAAAVNTGNNVLYLIFSLMLGLIVVSGMLSRRILRGLQAALEFPSNLFAGSKNVCYISIANSKTRIPSLGIRFVAGGKDFPGISRYFFYVQAGTEAHGFAPVLFLRRGLFHLKEFEIQTRFPFSFFVKSRRYFVEQQARVYPQIYHLSDEWLMRYAEGLLFESPYRGESHQLLHLRPYGPNDSTKRIHWKASARAPHFLVKEFQKEQGRDLYIYFDCYPVLPEQLPILDRAVSLLASVAFLVRRRGFEATFVFADRNFSIGSRDSQMTQLLDHLTEISAGAIELRHPFPTPESGATLLVIQSKHVSSIMPPFASAKTVTVEEGLAGLVPVDSQSMLVAT